MLEDFKTFITSPGLANAQFGVAVSGGIDSVALCELCAQSGVNFFLVHCNFKLRGEESERDENFVRSLAEKYAVQILVKKFDTEKYALENKCSIQVAARDLRYTWFTELHKENKNVYVLLAHHANDNIETLLMNFFRGSGIEGLTGMHSSSYHNCLRPLLQNTRAEIEVFVKERQLSWVEDSSNQENKYTRNFFRNELMPVLKKVYPSVEENLLDNISRFKRIDALYKIALGKIKKEVIELKGPEVVIPIHKLEPYFTTALIYEIIRDFGFGEKQVEEVLKLAKSESGRYIENNSHQIIRHRKNLVITPKSTAPKTFAIIEKNTETAELAGLQLHCRLSAIENFKLNKTETVAQLDADVLEFPLLVRGWKEGDYFYPLGMRKKKKLARFFIDQKLSRIDKEKVWVVESGQKIVWVVGYRIDDRFKITERTKTLLEITASTFQTG